MRMCKSMLVAGEEGLEPSHAGIKIRCLYQLGDSPTLMAGDPVIQKNTAKHTLKIDLNLISPMFQRMIF